MNRPRLIVHTLASVDGRVSLGPGRTGFEDMTDPRWLGIWASETSLEESVRELAERFEPQAFLEGAGSFVTDGAEPPPLPPADLPGEELRRDYLPGGHRGWFAAVDGRGRLRSGMKEFPGWEGWHTLHLTSKAAPLEYLAFLRRREIPYLIAGEERVDLPAALSKMKTKLGVETVVCTAGSRLPGALLRAGLVDELSLILLPGLIGGSATPGLFRSPDLGAREPPVHLQLLSVEGEPKGRVRLRYRVVPVPPSDL